MFSKPLIFLLACVFNVCAISMVANSQHAYSDIVITGAMKNVMWKGQLAGIIDIDTIVSKKGLYGIGPLSYLKGEVLVADGKCYVSRVISGSEMRVELTNEASAPFFVHAHVNEWHEMELPMHIKTINDLETHIDLLTKEYKRPFAFKISGSVHHASIHTQNLPDGSKVSSPEEAHQGQTDYELKDEKVEIIGFFSTEHQGIFTHHDSYLHMHLITDDREQMGHLDEVEFNKMKLYLPVK